MDELIFVEIFFLKKIGCVKVQLNPKNSEVLKVVHNLMVIICWHYKAKTNRVINFQNIYHVGKLLHSPVIISLSNDVIYRDEYL